MRLLLATACATVLLGAACGPTAEPEEIRVSRIAMGTLVEIAARGPDSARLREAVELAFAEVERLEGLLSEWRETSEISLLNRSAGDEPVSLSPETLEILRLAVAIAAKTNGAFDPTVLPLVRLYGFAGDSPRVPDPLELQAATRAVGWQGIELGAGRARLTRQGAAIGLGGIAKGFIADRALAVLRQHGARAGLVNAGGDLALFDRDGPGWPVRIERPGDPGVLLAEIVGKRGGIATSSATYRSAEIDGARLQHVIDPRSGRPADGNQSASVFAETCARADALATALLVLGPAARSHVETHDGIEALLVGPGGERWASPGLAGRLQWFLERPEPGVVKGQRDQ